jgi:hypothetical protein
MFVLQPGALFAPIWPYFVVPGITALLVWQTYWRR